MAYRRTGTEIHAKILQGYVAQTVENKALKHMHTGKNPVFPIFFPPKVLLVRQFVPFE